MSTVFIKRILNHSKPSGSALGGSKVSACIFPIAEVAIGSVYLNECPRQPYIPIYLIVGGVFGLILAIFSCLPCTEENEDGSRNKLSPICTTWNVLTFLFLFFWFATGNVWIYSIYPPNYNKNTTNIDPYCNKTLYLFAFWTTTLVYILLCALLLYICCIFNKIMCCPSESDKTVEPL